MVHPLSKKTLDISNPEDETTISEMLGTSYSVMCHIPEERISRLHCYENLKTHRDTVCDWLISVLVTSKSVFVEVLLTNVLEVQMLFNFRRITKNINCASSILNFSVYDIDLFLLILILSQPAP
jgi:hypothetical protein